MEWAAAAVLTGAPVRRVPGPASALVIEGQRVGAEGLRPLARLGRARHALRGEGLIQVERGKGGGYGHGNTSPEAGGSRSAHGISDSARLCFSGSPLPNGHESGRRT